MEDLLPTASFDDRAAVDTMVEQLAQQVKNMKEYLPKVLSPDLILGYSKVLDLEDECNTLRLALNDYKQREAQLSRSCEALKASTEKDKQEFFQLKSEVSSLNELVAEQAGFCSTVGATTCNLLWKMSHCAGAVDSILTGNMLISFLQLANSSLDGFIETCHSLLSEESPEVNFVMALCGVLTNVFATPSGRDYLMSSGYGITLIDQYISILTKNVKSEQLKNIVLMAIYNISISQKGLDMVASRPALEPALTQILTCSSASGNHLQALRVLQSIVVESQNSRSASDITSQISPKLIQRFIKDSNPEIRSVARDMLQDFTMQREP